MLFDAICGDALEVLKGMDDNSVDAVVTDPPYGLSFMGKKWDYDVPNVEIWAECLRVLKPGGHLLAFAGTRTQHRMAVRIEDAGFEIRDMIAWVYGSGFPKSLDVSKAIDKAAGADREVVGVDPVRFARLKNQVNGSVSTGGQWEHGGRDVTITAPATPEAERWEGWGTALKPALEPITVARKPLAGTVAANVLAHSTGALNIDGCRVAPTGESRERAGEASQERRYADVGGTNFAALPGVRGGAPAGRWPANLIHDGSEEVLASFPDAKGQQGDLVGHGNQRQSPNGCYGKMGPAKDHAARIESGQSAARFFYCAKASKKDRGEGNNHPTVKPTDLMRYLCRLVTPPGGTVLDPFMGSGSTGKAALLEGFLFIGIERDADYVEIARRRLDAAEKEI